MIDANVLIDYQAAGLEIIELIVKFLGPLHIPMEVLGEVDGLDEETARSMGAILVETTNAQRDEAGNEQELKKALSYPDAICLVLARTTGWTCITNDKALRSRSKASNVKVIWGLETLALIYEAGGITKDQALAYGERIQAKNPFHITDEIMQRFQDRMP